MRITNNMVTSSIMTELQDLETQQSSLQSEVSSGIAVTHTHATVVGGTARPARAIDAGPGIGMRQPDRARIPCHRRGPTLVATRLPVGVDTTHVMQSAASL